MKVQTIQIKQSGKSEKGFGKNKKGSLGKQGDGNKNEKKKDLRFEKTKETY